MPYDPGNNRLHAAAESVGRTAYAHRCRAPFAALVLLVLALPLTIDAAVTVEFPGPLAAQVTGGATVAITVPWDEAEPHRTVVGTGDGAVTILRYDAFSDAFVTASRTLLGGRVTGLAPLLDAAGEVVQLAVATVDPDRVVICDLFRSGALLVVRQTIELEEDPAGLDGLGVAGARTDALAVGLVGLDRIQLLERGPLEWGITATFDSGDGPRVLVGTDLDGDGRDELAVAHVGALSNSVSVFIWTDGHLDFVEDRRLVASPVGLAAMDREGDGRSELVALTAGTALAHELAWNGSSLAVVRDITLTLDAESLATGRLPDGRTGLYVANRERALVEAFLTGGGGWQRQDSYYPACQPGALVAAEFNRDGRVDLVSLGSAKNLVTLMLGSNDDGFWGYPVLSLSGTPAAMTRGDFNGDGLLDVAVISNFSDVLSVFLGHGDGLATVPVDRALGFLPGDLVPLQVDADPEYEIAIVSLGDRGVRVIDRSPTGDWTTLTTVVMDERPSQLRTADVDGDGATDLVALDNTVPEVTVLFGDGAGAFPASTTTGFVWQAHDVVAVDLDADGDRELVATDGFFRIQIRTNLDGRSFGDESRVNAATGAGPLCVGDLDGDLDEDVVVANVEESSLTFLENIGDGTLVRRIGSYAVPGSPENLTVADMNDDGIADIVINLRENGTVAILLGFGNWTWTPADEYVVAGDIVFFFAADVNADQIPDILTLDATLNLGLALLNMERTTVSTGPVPLEASCEAGDLVVQVRPGDAKWWLDAGLRGVWRPMADRHGTLAGHLERIGDAWRLVVPGGDLTAVDLPAGADRLRLRMGDGEGVQEFLADLPGPCAPGEPSSAVAWSREPWPNPFNPVIHARFTLEKPSRISAGVYDLQGRLVHELLAGRRAAGDHVLRWDGTVAGRPGSAGVYLLRVETERAVLARKVVLLK